MNEVAVTKVYAICATIFDQKYQFINGFPIESMNMGRKKAFNYIFNERVHFSK